MSQVCPRCGALVPDGSATCPRCHASTQVTQKISVGDLVWCPGCGALVPPSADVCPKCGRIIREEVPERPVRDLGLPQIDGPDAPSEAESARTGVRTRIESAIPPASDESSPAARRDRMPRPRAFAFAALFAVAVVGGAALLITHPWDPTASVTRASEPADTSMSGYPGAVESLSGQDREGADADGAETDPFAPIEEAYAALSELERATGESEDALLDACETGDASAIPDGLSQAEAISIDVSNLISDAALLDDCDGLYAEDLEHIQTLGNWLRNRCDALTRAWQQASDASDLSASADTIASVLRSGSDYERLFAENYDAWKPTRAQ